MGETIVDHDKRVLRNAAVRRREKLHAERSVRAGKDLADQFMTQLQSAASGVTVALYWSMRTEIDTRPLAFLLREIATAIAFPVIHGSGQPLGFRLWTPGDALQRGIFGTREPADTAPEVRPRIVVLPLLAFDREGNRLGYGGGYYDRTLRFLRENGAVKAVGAAYDEQEFPRVPTGPQDEKLDMIVTDRRTLLFDGAPGKGRTKSECVY